MSTRKTHGLHPWRYIPRSPYTYYLFTPHYSNMEQPPTRGCPQPSHFPPLPHQTVDTRGFHPGTALLHFSCNPLSFFHLSLHNILLALEH